MSVWAKGYVSLAHYSWNSICLFFSKDKDLINYQKSQTGHKKFPIWTNQNLSTKTETNYSTEEHQKQGSPNITERVEKGPYQKPKQKPTLPIIDRLETHHHKPRAYQNKTMPQPSKLLTSLYKNTITDMHRYFFYRQNVNN